MKHADVENDDALPKKMIKILKLNVEKEGSRKMERG